MPKCFFVHILTYASRVDLMGIQVGGTRKASASVLSEVESIQMKGKMA
jgi:hypothetical protein